MGSIFGAMFRKVGENLEVVQKIFEKEPEAKIYDPQKLPPFDVRKASFEKQYKRKLMVEQVYRNQNDYMLQFMTETNKSYERVMIAVSELSKLSACADRLIKDGEYRFIGDINTYQNGIDRMLDKAKKAGVYDDLVKAFPDVIENDSYAKAVKIAESKDEAKKMSMKLVSYDLFSKCDADMKVLKRPLPEFKSL